MENYIFVTKDNVKSDIYWYKHPLVCIIMLLKISDYALDVQLSISLLRILK